LLLSVRADSLERFYVNPEAVASFTLSQADWAEPDYLHRKGAARTVASRAFILNLYGARRASGPAARAVKAALEHHPEALRARDRSKTGVAVKTMRGLRLCGGSAHGTIERFSLHTQPLDLRILRFHNSNLKSQPEGIINRLESTGGITLALQKKSSEGLTCHYRRGV
jgi:hypothetical protein